MVEPTGVNHTETELRTTEMDDEAHRLPEFLRMADNECFLRSKGLAGI